MTQHDLVWVFGVLFFTFFHNGKSKIKKKKKGFKKTNRNKTFFVFCFLKSLKNICGDNTRYCHHSNSFRMMQLSLSTTWERKLRCRYVIFFFYKKPSARFVFLLSIPKRCQISC